MRAQGIALAACLCLVLVFCMAGLAGYFGHRVTRQEIQGALSGAALALFLSV